MVKPSNLFESEYRNKTNNLVQRYFWNAVNCGHTTDMGAELYDDWLTRGWIWTTDFTKPKADKSTQLQVQMDFGDLNTSEDIELLIAAKYRNVCRVSVKNGLVVDVLVVEG